MSIALSRSSIHYGAAALAATAVLVAGCGGSGQPSDVGGGLSGALHAVSDSSPARAYFEWGDVPTQRQLAGASATGAPLSLSGQYDSRWVRIAGVGAGYIGTVAPAVASNLRFSPYAASVAITVGEPPSSASRFDGPGIDGAAVAGALRRAGAKPQGGLLTLQSGLTTLNGILGPGVIRASASGHTVAIGRSQAAVSAVLGRGATLGAQPAYQAAANCLGDVVWAVIAPPRALNAEPGPELVAIGGRRPAGASSPAVEVLCAIDRGSALADSHERALRRMLGPSGILVALNAPVSEVVADSSVTRAGSAGLQVARALLTLRGHVPAGFLLQQWETGELGVFLATTCRPQQILGPNASRAAVAQVCRRLGLPNGP